MSFKNIAIYYPSLEHFGGIESVIIQQLRIFDEAGYKCYIITDEPIIRCVEQIFVNKILLPQDEKRSERLKEILTDNRIEVILINGAAFPSTASDINVSHEVGVKVVLTIHFSFPSPMIFNEAWDCYKINREIGKACDAVVTVSQADATWWRALGCNAYYIQNPFQLKKIADKNYLKENVIVWVGREAEQKQMFEALKIVAKVKREIPDVVLRMVGPDLSNSTRKILQKLDIERNVRFYPNEKNVSQHYAAAKLHLLTSITESFCLVIAEAKSFSIPTVMYSIPFLELIKDGKGIVEVEQSDSYSAAKEIVRLLKDDASCRELGSKASTSLEYFNDQNVLTGWKSVFNHLLSPVSSQGQDESYMYIKQIYDAWEYQRSKNQFKIDFFEELRKIMHNDCRGFVDKFMRFIVKPLKNIKNKLR